METSDAGVERAEEGVREERGRGNGEMGDAEMSDGEDGEGEERVEEEVAAVNDEKLAKGSLGFA